MYSKPFLKVEKREKFEIFCSQTIFYAGQDCKIFFPSFYYFSQVFEVSDIFALDEECWYHKVPTYIEYRADARHWTGLLQYNPSTVGTQARSCARNGAFRTVTPHVHDNLPGGTVLQ